MALIDPTKKKRPGDISDLSERLGIPGGVPLPAGTEKVFHSPVQPGLVQPTPPAPVTAYGAGQSARSAVGTAVGAIGNAGAAVLRPQVNALRAGGDFGRGLFGVAPDAPVSASPVASAQAAPLPAPSAIKPVIVDPSNAASMQLTPPSRADAYPVRPSASPASQAGASAPAGGGAAPFAGQYNAGQGASYTTGEGRQGQLPAGVAVVRQRNGVNAFGATGASVAAATGQPQSAPALAMPTSPNLAVPGITLPSVNTSRVSDAERERAALAKQIGDQADLLNFQGLNTRGKRELYASLLSQQAGLTRQAGDLAGSAAGQQLSAATQAGTSTQAQVGENARTQLNDQGATLRTGINEQGANARALLDLQRPSQVTDANGNLLSVTGSKAQPVVDANGNPVRSPMTKAEGAVTPALVYAGNNDQIKALTDSLATMPATSADDPRSVQLAKLQAANAQLQGGGAKTAPAPQVGTVKNGYRFKGGDPANPNSWEKTR